MVSLYQGAGGLATASSNSRWSRKWRGETGFVEMVARPDGLVLGGVEKGAVAPDVLGRVHGHGLRAKGAPDLRLLKGLLT